jgi:hypothetical protein
MDDFPRLLADPVSGEEKREWTRRLTPYKHDVHFTGANPGYVGTCLADSTEIEYFREIFDVPARFVVTMTNRMLRRLTPKKRRKKDPVRSAPDRSGDLEVRRKIVKYFSCNYDRISHFQVRKGTLIEVEKRGQPVVVLERLDLSRYNLAEPRPHCSRTPQPGTSRTVETQTESVNNKRARKKKMPTWQPLTLAEFYGFLAVLIIMGYNKLPEIKHYWSTSSDLGLKAVKDAFTYRRFAQIWKMFHYSSQPSYQRLGCLDEEVEVDDEEAVEGDRLDVAAAASQLKCVERNRDAIIKVRLFCEMVNSQFRKCRNPTRILCIDETITPFKGRSSIKVCQPRKPKKWGFEHFTLCEVGSGYILNDEAHLGKKQKMVFDGSQEPRPR